MKKYIFLSILFLLLLNNSFSKTIPIIGVSNPGENNSVGILTRLSLLTEKGEGEIFLNINRLTEIDTQVSIRLANEVACEISEKDCSKLDFYYSVDGNFPKIGGPSAGAAMAILTLSELNNEEINKDIAITGTVNPDGSIGNVGGTKEKILAAQEEGMKYFLIPFGESKELENESFNIKIIEVSTINEAYAIFTNKNFTNKYFEINTTTYNDFMKKMSVDLINYSNILFNNLNKMIDNTNLSNNSNMKTIVNSLFNQTILQRGKVNDSNNQGNYYSAASFSVGVSINSLYLTYLLNNFKENNTNYSLKLFNDTNSNFNDFKKILYENITFDNINDLEAINIVIARFFEAKEYLNTANNSLHNNNTYDFFYNIAFANVRLKTAESWKTLLNEFNGNLSINFNQNLFQKFALNRIEIASTLFNYANNILPANYINSAKIKLESSKKLYNNKDYIYSIFESLKSISELNYAMEINGFTNDNVILRINLSASQARQNINKTQNKNITPILALSYYEYAKEFERDNPIQSLIFLEYSKQFALLTEQMINQIWVINPIINEFEEKKEQYAFTYGLVILLFFIISVIVILKGVKV